MWGRYHGFKTMLQGLEGVSLRQAMPERAKGVTEQTEALVSVLEDHGVIVHRPRPLTDMEIAASPLGLFNQYARDPQIVIGKHVIETNLRMMFRCKEHLGYEQFFRTRLSEDPGARHVRMPDTTPILSGETEDEFLNDPRPFLEGGDTFVLGNDILVGFSSLGSSPAGAARLISFGGHSNEVRRDRRLVFHPARNRQIFRAQEFRVEEFRLVARAGIGEDGHNRVAFAEIRGETDRARDIDA